MPTTDKSQAEEIVEIRNEEGLHMRPAMQFVERACSFSSSISVCKDDQRVDGKSIMQVTMLAATKGTRLRILAEGTDAQEAVKTLSQLLRNVGLETPD